MRAELSKTVILYGKLSDYPDADWDNAPLMDAPFGLELDLDVTKGDVWNAKMARKQCVVAQGCRRDNYAYFDVGVDVAWIGAKVDDEYTKLRYRTGCIPRKYDNLFRRVNAAEAEASGEDVQDIVNEMFDLATTVKSFKLRPFTETQSLEAKKKSENKRMTTTGYIKPTGKKRKVNSRSMKPFVRRGRVGVHDVEPIWS